MCIVYKISYTISRGSEEGDFSHSCLAREKIRLPLEKFIYNSYKDYIQRHEN